jgi:hypothetical protein
MAVGLAVVIALGISHWDTVRDHVEAWHFQLTTKTETIEPDPESWVASAGDVTVFDVSDCLHLLSTLSGLCVIVEPASVPSLPKKWTGVITVTSSEGWATLTEATTTAARNALLLNGWRVLEQRFPRRAYVVIRDPALMKPGIHLAPKN